MYSDRAVDLEIAEFIQIPAISESISWAFLTPIERSTPAASTSLREAKVVAPLPW